MTASGIKYNVKEERSLSQSIGERRISLTRTATEFPPSNIQCGILGFKVNVYTFRGVIFPYFILFSKVYTLSFKIIPIFGRIFSMSKEANSKFK